MKTSLATSLSIIGVLATGGVALATNSTMVDSTLSVDTTVPVTTTIPQTQTSTTIPAPVQSAYDIQGVGIITLEQDPTNLNVFSVSPGSGWTYVSTSEDATKVELEFTNGTQKVKFTAELLDGRVVTTVEATDTSIAPSNEAQDKDEDEDENEDEDEAENEDENDDESHDESHDQVQDAGTND